MKSKQNNRANQYESVKTEEKKVISKQMQDCSANLNESGKTQEKEKENRNVQKKYRANRDGYIKAQERGKLRKV